MRTSILIVALLSATILFSQSITVTKSNSSTIPADGLYYALPKTMLQLKVLAIKKTWKKSKSKVKVKAIFKDIRLPKPITASEEIKYLPKSLKLASFASPDMDNIYKINVKKRWNKKNTVGLQISSSGLIQGSKLLVEDKTFDILTSILNVIGTATIGVSRSNQFYESAIHGKDIFEEVRESNIRGPYTDLKSVTEKSRLKFEKIIKEKVSIDKLLEEYSKKERELSSKVVLTNINTNNANNLAIRLKELRHFQTSLLKKRKTIKTLFINELDKIMGSLKTEELEIVNELPLQLPIDEITYCFKLRQKGNEFLVEKYDESDFEDQEKPCPECYKLVVNSNTKAIGKNFVDHNGNHKGLAYKVPVGQVARLYNQIEKIGDYPFLAAGPVGRMSEKINVDNFLFYENLGWFKDVNASTNAFNSAGLDTLTSSFFNTAKNFKRKSEFDLLKEETDLLELKLKKLKTEADIQSIQNGTPTIEDQ